MFNHTNKNSCAGVLYIFLILSMIFYATGTLAVDHDFNPEKTVFSGYDDAGKFTKLRDMKEYINPSNGILTLVANDMVLPGRNGMDVKLNRIYKSDVWRDPGSGFCAYDGVEFDDYDDGQVDFYGPFGLGWDFSMGEIQITLDDNGGYELEHDDYCWISLGDGIRYEIAPISDCGSNQKEYMVKGKPKWKLMFLTNPHYKFTLTTEDGTQYFFNRGKYRLSACGGDPYGWNTTIIRFWVTKVVDTNGNYIDICYYLDEQNQIDCAEGYEFGTFLADHRMISKITDNLGRVITLHINRIPRHYPWPVNLQYDYVEYTGPYQTPIRIIYEYDNNFILNHGQYSDPINGDYAFNETMVLTSVQYFRVIAPGEYEELGPPIRYEYDNNFGVLTKIDYETGGEVRYDYARILDGYGHINKYGYIRLIQKTLDTPGQDAEVWQYKYGSGGSWDAYSGTHPYSTNLNNSSIGQFRMDHYVNSYQKAKVIDPQGDSTIYYYFIQGVGVPPGNEDHLGLEYVGQVEKVRTYSEDNVLLEEKRYYYDRTDNVIKNYWDCYNARLEGYHSDRLIGELTFKYGSGDPAQYFIENSEFDEYERCTGIEDYGDVTSVGWVGSYPATNGFIVYEPGPGGVDGDKIVYYYKYLDEDNSQYAALNILDRIEEFKTCDRFGNLDFIEYSYYDEAGHNLEEFSPAGTNPVMWNPPGEYRGNLSRWVSVNNGYDPRVFAYCYDPAGNVVTMIKGSGDAYFQRMFRYEYSPSFQRAYATKYSIEQGSVDPSRNYDYDFNTGKIIELWDFNGNLTSIGYDRLGRYSYVDFPVMSIGQRSIEFIYCDRAEVSEWYEVTKSTKIQWGDPVGQYKYEKYFVDGAGRICQYQLIDHSGDVIVENTNRYWYDDFIGTEVKPFIKPYTGGSFIDPWSETGLDSVTYTYDGIGKKLETQFTYLEDPPNPPERQYSSYMYDANEAIFRDEDDNKTKYIYGARDALREEKWGGPIWPAGDIYTYDHIDRLAQFQNSVGQISTYEYDQHNNIIQSEIVDQEGETKYVYGETGFLMFKQNPNRKADAEYGWIYYKYDNKVDRLVEEGLLALPGDCEPQSYPSGRTITLRVDPDEDPEDIQILHRDDFNEDQIATFEVDFNSEAGPPEIPEEVEPGFFRGRYFKVFIENQTTPIIDVSNDEVGTFRLDDRYEYYTIILFDNYSRYSSWAIVSYNHTVIQDCNPDYIHWDKFWTKKYMYDEYNPGTDIPDGLDNPIGNLTMMKSRDLLSPAEEDSTIFFYDARNRLCEKWVGFAGLSGFEIIHYEYNDGNLLTSIEYPNGYVVSYDYDNFGRLWHVGNETDNDYYATITYTPSSKIETLVLGQAANPSQTVDFEYNANRDWLTAINAGGVVSGETGNGNHYSEIITYYSGGYDPPTNNAKFLNGNIASVSHSYSSPHNNANRLTHSDYDERNRLLHSFVNVGSDYNEAFNYDNNGRIDYYVRADLMHGYTYHSIGGTLTNRVDRIWNWNQNPGILQYDPNGNLIEDPDKGLTLTWDYRNMPTSADIGSDQLEFRYDADNLRTRKSYTTGGETNTTFYMYSGENPIAEFYEDGAIKRINIYAGERLIAHRDFVPDEICEGYLHCNQDLVHKCTPINCEIVPGDANGSGTANGLDVTYLVAYLKGGPPPVPPHSQSDVNCSGSVNGGDVIYMQNYFRYGFPPLICCYYHCGMLYYHLTDHLGSTKVLVDSTGRMFSVYDYFATGEKTDLNWVNKGTEYQFTGKQYDDEAGFNMNYFGARYYDPRAIMFISIDPSYSKYLGWSPYIYALDNPLKFVDPDGEGIICKGSENFPIIERLRYIDNQLKTEQNIIKRGLLYVQKADILSMAVFIIPDVISHSVNVTAIAGEATISATATGKDSPNPYGAKGKPDHQQKVEELGAKARQEAAPGEIVDRETKIKGYQSSRRIPDQQIIDKTGKTRKVFEAERNPNSKYNKNKTKEYDDLGIGHETHPLD